MVRRMVWRMLAGALAVGALVTAAPAAAGQPPTQLWDEFPLTPTTSQERPHPAAPAERVRPTPAGRSHPTRATPDEQAARPLSYLALGLIGITIWAGLAVALRTKGWNWTLGGWRPRVERLGVALAGEEGQIALLPARVPAAAGPAPDEHLAAPRKPRGPVRVNGRPPDKSLKVKKKHPRAGTAPRGKQLSAARCPRRKKLYGPPAGKETPPRARGRPAKSEPKQAPSPRAKDVRRAPPVPEPAPPQVQESARPPASQELVPLPRPESSSSPNKRATTRTRPGAGSRRHQPKAPVRFETCVIKRWNGYVRSDFYAQAARPDGSEYLVARSPMFSPRGRRSEEVERQAYQALVEKLRADGWESENPGLPWYRQRFRRPSRTLHDLVSDLQSARRPS